MKLLLDENLSRLLLGNCSSKTVLDSLIRHAAEMEMAFSNAEIGILDIS